MSQYATIAVAIWKEHTCVTCGTRYRYLMERKVTSIGSNAEAARRNAEDHFARVVARRADMRPCPGCGRYQPDMIAGPWANRHGWAFVALVPVLCLVCYLLLEGMITLSTGSLLLAAAAVASLVAHVVIARSDPNANLAANRELAARQVEKRDVLVTGKAGGDVALGDPGRGVGAVHKLSYILAVTSVLCFLAPIGAKVALGMQTSSNWNPDVIGPGETAYVWFPDSVNSVRGYWRGNAKVTVINGDAVGAASASAFRTETNGDNWSSTILAKSSAKDNSSRLWVRVRVPDDPALVGKTLKLRIDLTTVRPVAGGKGYTDVSDTHTYTTALTVSKPGDGARYVAAWWVGLVGGVLMNVAAGVLLVLASLSFAKKALPAAVVRPDFEAGENAANRQEPRRDPGENEGGVTHD